MSYSITATYEFDGFVDYWEENGRRWDDDAGCLFAYLHKGITCREVVDQLVQDFQDTGEFDHPIWNDVSDEDIRAACLAMVKDPDDLDQPLEGYEDIEIDENDESPVFVALLEIDADDVEEYNADILSEFFKGVEDWIDEYVQSDDYAGEYSYLMKESDRINESCRRLLRNFDLGEGVKVEDIADDVATEILNSRRFDFFIVDEYSSESCGYLDSFQISEYEYQIDVSQIREQIEDKIVGDFWQALEDWIEDQRDHCIRTWGSTPLKDQKYPCVYLIVNTGYRVDYVVDTEEVLEEIVDEILQARTEDDQDTPEPEDEDFVLQPSGTLGGKTSVSRHNGEFLGEFTSEDEAMDFIRETMRAGDFFPDVRYVSDHGTWSHGLKRDYTCLECKHKWSRRVSRSGLTPNISGEPTAYCPECASRSVMGEPPYQSQTN
jgi:hypothetical protein